MKKILIGSLATLALSPIAFAATTSEVLCESNYTLSEGGILAPYGFDGAMKKVTDAVNERIKALSKTKKVVAVSAPGITGHTGHRSMAYDGVAALCVTVTTEE